MKSNHENKRILVKDVVRNTVLKKTVSDKGLLVKFIVTGV